MSAAVSPVVHLVHLWAILCGCQLPAGNLCILFDLLASPKLWMADIMILMGFMLGKSKMSTLFKRMSNTNHQMNAV